MPHRSPSEARRAHVLAIVVSLAACLAAPVAVDELRGRVVGVADGDTLTVLDASRQQHKVRVNGIDAPESGQAFGQVSKQHLSTLVFGQDVVVVWEKTDQYGRLVGTVLRGDVDAGLEQLRAGLAWYFRRYASDVPPTNRSVYDAAETTARTKKLGLWRDANPMAPWAYRGGEPAPVVSSAPAASSTARAAVATIGQVIGNRNSHIYHVPGCRSYNAVAERNRVYFHTEAEATAAGYRKARNCN